MGNVPVFIFQTAYQSLQGCTNTHGATTTAHIFLIIR